MLVIMGVALLTNQAVFDNISLVKVKARGMLAFFLCFIATLLHSDFNLENKA